MAFQKKPMKRFRMPRISTRQEALLWFVCAAVGYQLTQALLPSQRLALAQRIEPEPVAETVRRVHATQLPEVDARRTMAMTACQIPPGGGPPLNSAFEPC